MTRLVADTNVLSYLFKGHSLAPAYAEKLRGAQVAYALQTWAELRAWALAGGWGERRRADLNDFLGDFVLLGSTTRQRGATLNAARCLDSPPPLRGRVGRGGTQKVS